MELILITVMAIIGIIALIIMLILLLKSNDNVDFNVNVRRGEMKLKKRK
jgi:hypothetical protein